MISNGSNSSVSEAQVVFWLKKALVQRQFFGDRARDILVDADGAYLHSPYRKQLEPTGAIWIGDWRADLVCLLDSNDVERVVGFEVKAQAGLEKGIVQASRYRIGVHDSYLCVPRVEAASLSWLTDAARQNGIGLVLASDDGVEVRVAPPPTRPDPRILLTTRRYLLGEGTVRALGLNKSLHYVAVLMACIETRDPYRALVDVWQLKETAVRHAFRGAETLGLVVDGHPTHKGRAYAGVFTALGFTIEEERHLTRVRLVDHRPGYAAVLRAILLDNPAVALVVQALEALGGGPVSADRLAARAHVLDEGMARAVFGVRLGSSADWQIRPSTRFNLKAALYDVGLIESRLSRGAGSSADRGGYDPANDVWSLA